MTYNPTTACDDQTILIKTPNPDSILHRMPIFPHRRACMMIVERCSLSLPDRTAERIDRDEW